MHTALGHSLPQAAASASRGWESWMRSAWGRWHRTKDATQETWDAAKDQAYRQALSRAQGAD